MKKENLISLLVLLVINVFCALLAYLMHGMYDFLHPERWWGLLFIPILSVHFQLIRRRSRARVAMPSMPHAWRGIFPQVHQHLLFSFRMLAVTVLVVVIARPQSSDSFENLTREGINIMLAIDVSSSMLSKDFEPDRLESAKRVAIDFVAARPDDRIGVVVYEGESITQVPLTTDHRVVKQGLSSLQTGMLSNGTAIGMGLATAVNRLRESEGDSKVIILLTDGVNNSGQIKPADAAQMAALYGIRVYTIGVGTIGKAKSPVGIRDGRYVYDWVEVEIDEKTLKGIAEETGGRYFRATSQNKLESIYQEIDTLEKTRFNVFQYDKKTEEFLLPLLFAIALLILEQVLRFTLLRTAI